MQLSPLRQRRRGSAMIELALILPVLAVMTIGSFGVIIVAARAMQAGSVSRLAGALAASGTDLSTIEGKRQILEAARGLGLEKGDATLIVTEIIRDGSGYRLGRTLTIGNEVRWKSSITQPDTVIELEPGESAWVTEVVADSLRVGFGPAEVRARNIS